MHLRKHILSLCPLTMPPTGLRTHQKTVPTPCPHTATLYQAYYSHWMLCWRRTTIFAYPHGSRMHAPGLTVLTWHLTTSTTLETSLLSGAQMGRSTTMPLRSGVGWFRPTTFLVGWHLLIISRTIHPPITTRQSSQV